MNESSPHDFPTTKVCDLQPKIFGCLIKNSHRTRTRRLVIRDVQLTLVGCWYHARRKFVEAAKVSVQLGLAKQAIKFIKKLSDIEKDIKRPQECCALLSINVNRFIRKYL